MGYNKSTGDKRAARTRSVTLQAAVTKTATFKSAGVELADQNVVRLNLAVTAHAGTTPTLDVKVQTSKDDVDADYVDVPNGAFAQVTTTNGTTRLVVGALDRFVRVVATIAGTTPSYTYSVSGESA